jgi:hypothetical protein
MAGGCIENRSAVRTKDLQHHRTMIIAGGLLTNESANRSN